MTQLCTKRIVTGRPCSDRNCMGQAFLVLLSRKDKRPSNASFGGQLWVPVKQAFPRIHSSRGETHPSEREDLLRWSVAVFDDGLEEAEHGFQSFTTSLRIWVKIKQSSRQKSEKHTTGNSAVACYSIVFIMFRLTMTNVHQLTGALNTISYTQDYPQGAHKWRLRQ